VVGGKGGGKVLEYFEVAPLTLRPERPGAKLEHPDDMTVIV